jgi:hypothetical protein
VLTGLLEPRAMFSARAEPPKSAIRDDQVVPVEPQLWVPDTHPQEGSPSHGPGTYCTSMSLTTVQGESCCSPQPPRTRLSE